VQKGRRRGLGLFCLGAFVGTIGTLALKFVKGIPDWRNVLTMSLPAVLSGIVVVFVDKFKYSPALGCYPLGLLVSLLWAFSDNAVQNIISGENDRRMIGFAHLTAAILLTLGAGAVVVVPVIFQLRDKWKRPVGDVLEEFRRQQERDASNDLKLMASSTQPTIQSAGARRQ
jgi:hypothetical protein